MITPDNSRSLDLSSKGPAESLCTLVCGDECAHGNFPERAKRGNRFTEGPPDLGEHVAFPKFLRSWLWFLEHLKMSFLDIKEIMNRSLK